MAWLIAEGPGPDGRIRGAPQGAYSPWLFLLSIVFFFVGTRWASGRSLFGPPGRAEARWGFGCLALIASILLLAGFSLVAQAFGSGVLSEAFWVQAAKAIIPIAIGVGLFEIGSRMIRSAERAAGAIAAQPSQTLEDR